MNTTEPASLDTLARTLEALPCVIDAHTHRDLCEWVEVAIEGIGVPPEVQTEFTRAGVSIIDVSDQAGAFTVAQVREVRRGEQR